MQEAKAMRVENLKTYNSWLLPDKLAFAMNNYRFPNYPDVPEEISDNNSTDQSSVNDEQSNAEEEEKLYMEQEELRPEPMREELG